jgi:hypothetical protein
MATENCLQELAELIVAEAVEIVKLADARVATQERIQKAINLAACLQLHGGGDNPPPVSESQMALPEDSVVMPTVADVERIFEQCEKQSRRLQRMIIQRASGKR